MDLTQIAQPIINGIAIGSIIALAAIGLTLTYGILKLSNFAHGDYVSLGAYLTWVANTAANLNIWIAMIVGAVGTTLAMLAAEFLLWKPMRDRRANSTTLIIISIGLALFIRSGILLVWGSSTQSYDLPIVPALDIGGVRIAFNRIVAIGLTVVAVVVLNILLQRSKIGKAMRAVADNIDLARVTGIDVERVVLWTWMITGILTALSGSLYGLIATIRPNMGWFLLIPIFAATILGGIGNVYGAIIGALIIGVTQELSVEFFRPEYKPAVALVIMVVVLFLRPSGLFRGTA